MCGMFFYSFKHDDLVIVKKEAPIDRGKILRVLAMGNPIE